MDIPILKLALEALPVPRKGETKEKKLRGACHLPHGMPKLVLGDLGPLSGTDNPHNPSQACI